MLNLAFQLLILGVQLQLTKINCKTVLFTAEEPPHNNFTQILMQEIRMYCNWINCLFKILKVLWFNKIRIHKKITICWMKLVIREEAVDHVALKITDWKSQKLIWIICNRLEGNFKINTISNFSDTIEIIHNKI